MNHFLQLPPLHPILVHFPVALLPVSFACDLFAKLTKRHSLAHAAWWALLFAAIVAPFTAATGWLWMREMSDMPHGDQMLLHQWLGTALPFILIPLAAWRFRFHANVKLPSGAYLAACLVTLLAVTLQGHLGGMMSFGGEAGTKAMNQESHHHPGAVSTAPASQPSGEDGWSDSIHLNGAHHHE